MTELIEKTSYKRRGTQIGKILADPVYEEDVERLRDYIAKEVELAYKAGMLRFSALDHTFKQIGSSTVLQWHKENLSSMEVGEGALLPSLYLQAKGFKR